MAGSRAAEALGYSALVTPQKIGPDPIEREVGRGGMGVVYLGRDTRLDRPVAIATVPVGKTVPGISVAVNWRGGRE